MRFYAFNNMYWAGIHNGIQADHAKDEIWASVTKNTASAQFATMVDFVRNHKTTIILHAGDHKALSDAFATLFLDENNPYPCALFREPGMNYAVSSIGIVIPERLYDDIANTAGRVLQTPEVLWSTTDRTLVSLYTPWEQAFLKFKSPCPLAR